jgi:5-methylcytosine-specific restriction enzyme B
MENLNTTNTNEPRFTWIPIHKEAIHRLLGFRHDQKALLAILQDMENRGLKVISLKDYDDKENALPLAEIDPFTFLASFNRGITEKNRKDNWTYLKGRWSLKAPAPNDFTGIPIFFNLRSWLFPNAYQREPNHIDQLWEIAAQGADEGIEHINEALFNRCLRLKAVAINSLTIGLFWINPEKFLPADNKTTAYGKTKGVGREPKDYQSYKQWMEKIADALGHDNAEISHAAEMYANAGSHTFDLAPEKMQMLWARFHKGIKGFIDFKNPGAEFKQYETDYKRKILNRFNDQLGERRLRELLSHGQEEKAANEVTKILTSNLISFHAWRVTLGEGKAIGGMLRAFLTVASKPYSGPESTIDIFDAAARYRLKPNWDALSTLLWALRPSDYFPIKISFYRKLANEVGHELPIGRPDPEKLDTLIQFGRAFWKALEPQHPTDWVDVQSFIWCVLPCSHAPRPELEASDETKPPILSPHGSELTQYWTFSPGKDGDHWEEFYKSGMMAIGWKGTPDLRQFKNKEEIRKFLKTLTAGKSSRKNAALACWQFVHEIKARDIVFAKRGSSRILGYGVVQGDYSFDADSEDFRHFRKVAWKAKGEWELPDDDRMALKTLTNITPYPDFIKRLSNTIGQQLDPSSDRASYWWLNANPKIWNFEETPVGQRQTYTSHNEKGNKRQKFKYFQEVKPGDLVIGYVTSPQKEVVAVCKITKGLHKDGDSEVIEFEKIEQFSTPISFESLLGNPELSACEPLINNQGSLFRLTEQEFEIIRSLMDEANLPPKAHVQPYAKKDAMADLFLPETQFDEMLEALREKKNVVLQGAPGVGKSFVAKKLAYALVGWKDPKQVEMIQFHQSYSYEDFIQGFRPTPKGHFDLKYGVFYQFCRRAQREESTGKPFVFIIDEINRGNLSKIFGELMILIEPDKRGKEHSIPLAYSQEPDERFYLPENLYIIGMMNTADRSLAMVDYALRRRFRFITLRPEFESQAFRGYLAHAGAEVALINKIVSRMVALNEVVAADSKNLGPGYQIGHSYFCPRKGANPDEKWYRQIVEAEIVPLIQEYWFDNEQKVKEQRNTLLD